MFRNIALAVPVCLVALLAAGCSPSKADIEKSIREEMKTKMGVDITAIDLAKQSDGSFTGTATASNGDVYEVTATPPSKGQTEWKAIPGQAMVEKMLREGIEEQLKSKVKALQVTKQSAGVYTGTAELDSGMKLNVSTKMEGTNLMWQAEPALQ